MNDRLLTDDEIFSMPELPDKDELLTAQDVKTTKMLIEEIEGLWSATNYHSPESGKEPVNSIRDYILDATSCGKIGICLNEASRRGVLFCQD